MPAIFPRAPIDGNFGPDPMVNPRVPFPMIMLLAGMVVVAITGMAVQGRERFRIRDGRGSEVG